MACEECGVEMGDLHKSACSRAGIAGFGEFLPGVDLDAGTFSPEDQARMDVIKVLLKLDPGAQARVLQAASAFFGLS